MTQQQIIKQSAEQRFQEELDILSQNDSGAAKPLGWVRSPQAVRQFILGNE